MGRLRKSLAALAAAEKGLTGGKDQKESERKILASIVASDNEVLE